MKALLPLILLLCSLQTAAATFTVTRTDDRDVTCVSNVDCSLREAISAANASAGNDTINFKSGFGDAAVNLTAGELLINSNLTISGAAVNSTKIQRNSVNNFRIFNVSADAVVIFSNLIIANGYLIDDGGGGIYNAGTLTLNNVAVTGNQVIRNPGSTGVIRSAHGGGIFNQGTVNIINSTISNNQAEYGGGIFNQGAINLTNSNIEYNNVLALENTCIGGYGAGIYSYFGNLSLNNSKVSNNIASGGNVGGAGLYFDRGFSTINTSTISDNRVVASTVLNSCGVAIGGGAIIFGETTITNSIISNNTAAGRAGLGGGITIGSGQPVEIKNSSIINNKIEARASSNGGGISGGSFSLINSTVSGNIINDAGQNRSKGGGISATGNTILRNSTIVNNTAPIGGGISGDTGGPKFTIANTIIAQNNAVTDADASGTVISNGNNLIGNSAGSGGWLSSDILNVDPRLSPLANNGGLTPTHALLSGSPAINAGNNAGAPATDQRGFARINGAIIDIGAYESNFSNCIYSLPTSSSSFGSDGGVGILSLVTSAGCSWTATTNANWITLNVSSGSGNGLVNFTVAVNDTQFERSGTIFVGDQTFTVTQSRNCVYSLSSSSRNFASTGGDGSFNVMTYEGCNWTPVKDVSWIVLNSSGGSGSGEVSYTVLPNSVPEARIGTITVGNQTFSIRQEGITNTTPTPTPTPSPTPTPPAPLLRKIVYDFDGDRKDDISIYRDGTWWFGASSANDQHRAITFGAPTDRLVPADYDADGKTDPAVFRDGYWHILNSSTNGYSGMQFGFADDIPVPADYDGDGKADIAVYRPTDGYWYIMQSLRGFKAVQFGAATDKPVAADFDGDWLTDIAVFRPSNGTWYVLQSSLGFKAMQWGESTDVPTPGDYDGDGKADAAVWRPSNGTWYLMKSRDGFAAQQFGQIGDTLIPADYDGDGRTDIAVVRGGTWYQINSATGFKMTVFGYATDKPVPNSFVR